MIKYMFMIVCCLWFFFRCAFSTLRLMCCLMFSFKFIRMPIPGKWWSIWTLGSEMDGRWRLC